MSRFSVLVFHRAVGFVHQSIPDTVAAIEKLGVEHDFDVDATDDPGLFSPAVLAAHDVVVFAHTSGNVLPEAGQRRALEGFIRGGGGFFGIHGASSMDADVRTEWPWFVELLGSKFKGHTTACIYCDEPFESPGVINGGALELAPADAEWMGDDLAMTSWEDATLTIEDPSSPAVRGLVDGATYAEEWYGFDENPRAWVHVVATVDESTYSPFMGRMGDDHPVIWWREFDGGRSVYNSMGHAGARWREPWFLESILGGLELAAGVS